MFDDEPVALDLCIVKGIDQLKRQVTVVSLFPSFATKASSEIERFKIRIGMCTVALAARRAM